MKRVNPLDLNSWKMCQPLCHPSPLQQFARENVFMVDEGVGGMGESAEFPKRVGPIDTVKNVIDGATQKARYEEHIFHASSEEDKVCLIYPIDSLSRMRYSRSN